MPCSAGGSPPPTVTWRKADGGAPVAELPGLRQLRPDGSLVFPPFGVDQYRPDVHATSYRCEASNSYGIIGSRDVRVTAGMFPALLATRRTTRGKVANVNCVDHRPMRTLSSRRERSSHTLPESRSA